MRPDIKIEKMHEHIYPMMQNISTARDLLPKFLKMIETDATRAIQSQETKGDAEPEDNVLSVILIEKDEHEISNPDRLISVLVGVKLLYQVAAHLEGLSDSDLGVIGCDSGSDKSFDFIGAGGSIHRVKEIILSAWDRVIFYQEHKMEKRIEIIAKTLPVIEEINKKKKKLGVEQAKLLERAAMDGIRKILESGAMIPEIQEKTSYNPRELLAPQPKLLTHQDPPEESSVAPEKKPRRAASKKKPRKGAKDSPFEDIDAVEREELVRKLNELRGENGGDSE